jgi:hypothetical protein
MKERHALLVGALALSAGACGCGTNGAASSGRDAATSGYGSPANQPNQGTPGGGAGSSSGDASTAGQWADDATTASATDAGAASDDGGEAATNAPDGGAAGSDAPTASAFDTCVAALKPVCVVSDMNTAALMETPCAALQMIPIPLADGGTYGPMTIQGGPYGGKIDWNQGQGTTFVNQVNGLEPICVPTGIESFKEPASVNAQIENLRSVDYSLYTIFRPACFKPGEVYPVITWANGTCGEIAGYAPLLASIASYGFVIVASNSTWTATSPTNTVQARALDYAASLNADSTSIFYQRLDMNKIGAMGHSQGATATSNEEGDTRVKSLIFWNTGTSNKKPFLDISGERDVTATTPTSMASSVSGATQPGAWVYYHQVLETGGSSTGHLVLMEQPDRVVAMAVAWWQWQLNGDATAKSMFVGTQCGLCSSPSAYEYGHNSELN